MSAYCRNEQMGMKEISAGQKGERPLRQQREIEKLRGRNTFYQAASD